MATAARGVQTYLKFFQQENVHYVLDYGAGKLRNTKFLAEHGFKVYATDLPRQVAKIKTMPAATQAWGVLEIEELKSIPLKVDLVVTTYVLNILGNPQDRQELLYNCQAKLKPNGYFLVEVLCKDCLRNSFSKQELDDMILPLGFQGINFSFGRNAVAVLYRKKPVQKGEFSEEGLLTYNAFEAYNTFIEMSEMSGNCNGGKYGATDCGYRRNYPSRGENTYCSAQT